MHTYIRLFSGYFLYYILAQMESARFLFLIILSTLKSLVTEQVSQKTGSTVLPSLNYYSNLYGLFITFKINFEFYMLQIKSSPLVIIAHIVRAFLFANATTARLNPLLVFNSFSQLALFIGKFLVLNNTALAP